MQRYGVEDLSLKARKKPLGGEFWVQPYPGEPLSVPRPTSIWTIPIDKVDVGRLESGPSPLRGCRPHVQPGTIWPEKIIMDNSLDRQWLGLLRSPWHVKCWKAPGSLLLPDTGLHDLFLSLLHKFSGAQSILDNVTCSLEAAILQQVCLPERMLKHLLT